VLFLFLQAAYNQGKLKGSSSQNKGSRYRILRVMIIMDIIFIQNPVFAISGIRINPELNTMAFGGVATGSIKAQLAARQAEIISIYG